MADIVLINPKFEVSYWGMEYALPDLGKRADLPVAALPLLAALRERPVRPAELALKLGRDLPDTLALIAEAALEGWISRLPGGAIASLEG